ncbi:MAG: hypothetical protein IT542_13515 [Rubellimicrobium sp.]|nr:hypothetical protein [Rubellimicrobium sp.]
MKRMYRVAFVLAGLAGPAAAQDFDGVWLAQQNQANGTGSYELVLSGGSYALTATLVTPEGYTYQSYQSGAVELYPPDTLRLVVLDWSPREYLGQPMSMPPNSNLRVASYDGNWLTLVDNVCAMSAPLETCASTYRRLR